MLAPVGAAAWVVRTAWRRAPHPLGQVGDLLRESYASLQTVVAAVSLEREAAHPAWAVDDPPRVVAWVQEVWRAEGQAAPLWVQLPDEVPPGEVGLDLGRPGWGAARGRWEDGPPPRERRGQLAGTSGPVARLLLVREPRCASVLHDVAHLLEDGVGRLEGHGEGWHRRYAGLLHRHVGEDAALLWLRRLAETGPLPPTSRPRAGRGE